MADDLQVLFAKIFATFTGTQLQLALEAMEDLALEVGAQLHPDALPLLVKDVDRWCPVPQCFASHSMPDGVFQ